MLDTRFSHYIRPEGRSAVLALEGTLDLSTASRALGALREALGEHGPHLVVDTSRLDFIDSKGLGTLIEAAKAARDAGGSLYLRDPTLPLRKILETCGLLSLFGPGRAVEG